MSQDRLQREVDPQGIESASSAIDPDVEAKLLVLRMQLYTAAQSLKGAALEEFWQLLDEVSSTRVAV